MDLSSGIGTGSTDERKMTSLKSTRIDWERYALWLAWTASQRSEARATTKEGDEPRKTGAAVLERDTHRVLALGYNGFTAKFTPPTDFYSDKKKRAVYIVHAEINALSYVKRGEAGLLAVTLAPCAGCARAIIANGIKKVVYGEIHQDPTGIDILHFYNVDVIYIPIIKVLDEWVSPAITESATLWAANVEPCTSK
jgi:deoxycytidylate deaminase